MIVWNLTRLYDVALWWIRKFSLEIKYKVVEGGRDKVKKKQNEFMKSINEFDALLSNRSTSLREINSKTRKNFARKKERPVYVFCCRRRRLLLSELKNDPKIWMKVTEIKVLFATLHSKTQLDAETTSNVMLQARFTFSKRIVSNYEIGLCRVIKRRNEFELILLRMETMFWDITSALTGFRSCWNMWFECGHIAGWFEVGKRSWTREKKISFWK